MSAISSEQLYRRLGRIIEECPPFIGIGPLNADQMTWLGRAEALVEDSSDTSAQAEFMLGKQFLTAAGTRPQGHQKVMLALYRVLGIAELASPAAAQGAFIPVGGSFDAYAAVAKVFSQATSEIFVVDPYMDDSMLLEFVAAAPESTVIRLLSDQATVKQSLAPAAIRWKSQYPQRTLLIRLAPAKTLHDRAVFVDKQQAWTVTQSFKDLAKRAPAEIVRVNDIAPLKIAAYEQIWNSARVLV